MPRMRTQVSGVLFLLLQSLVFSDAWFWSWTGTTALAPTVDPEGSGSPAGSGEQPTEDTVTARVTEERPGIRVTEQNWVQSTGAPQQTTLVPPTAHLENDMASEKGTDPPSQISEPGNGSSSLMGVGSADFNPLRFSGLEADRGSGLWSGSGESSRSGFEEEAKADWFSGSDTHEFLEVNDREAVLTTDGVTLPDNYRNESNKSHLIIHRAEKVNASDESSQNLRSLLEIPVNNSVNYSPENSTSLDLLIPLNDTVSNLDSRGRQLTPVTDLPVTTQEPVVYQSVPTSQASTVSQRFQTAITATSTAAAQREDSTSTLATSHTLAARPSLATSSQQLTTVSKDVKTGGDRAVTESQRCVLLNEPLPFCSFMKGEKILVPNFVNQTSVEEVRALLTEWAWLLGSNCHHGVQWFFCLLLVPKCDPAGALPLLPCRSFCEVLRDSCWMLLDEGRLPVECHTLPDDDDDDDDGDDDDGYQCLSVSNQKGKSPGQTRSWSRI